MSTANKAARRGSGRSGSATVASPPQVATRTVRRLASGPTGYRNGQVKTTGQVRTRQAGWTVDLVPGGRAACCKPACSSRACRTAHGRGTMPAAKCSIRVCTRRAG